jgi:hypothetical protein
MRDFVVTSAGLSHVKALFYKRMAKFLVPAMLFMLAVVPLIMGEAGNRMWWFRVTLWATLFTTLLVSVVILISARRVHGFLTVVYRLTSDDLVQLDGETVVKTLPLAAITLIWEAPYGAIIGLSNKRPILRNDMFQKHLPGLIVVTRGVAEFDVLIAELRRLAPTAGDKPV